MHGMKFAYLCMMKIKLTTEILILNLGDEKSDHGSGLLNVILTMFTNLILVNFFNYN